MCVNTTTVKPTSRQCAVLWFDSKIQTEGFAFILCADKEYLFAIEMQREFSV